MLRIDHRPTQTIYPGKYEHLNYPPFSLAESNSRSDAGMRTVLWGCAAVALVGLAYRPAKLLMLLFAPFILSTVLLGALLFHLLLSYFAASASAKYARSKRDPIVPVLSIGTAAGIEAIRVRKSWLTQKTANRQPLHPTSPAVSAALDQLIAVVINIHLLSWYQIFISPSDPSFPYAVETTIRQALANFLDRVVEVDWANLGVSTLLPRITKHLELFQEAQRSLLQSSDNAIANLPSEGNTKERKKKQSPGATPASEELDLLLSKQYAELAGGSGLHSAVSDAGFNSRPSEERHLRRLVARIIKFVLPEREAGSSAVTTMTMEVIACAVIRPIIEAIADPDLWNRMLDERGGNVIRER